MFAVKYSEYFQLWWISDGNSTYLCQDGRTRGSACPNEFIGNPKAGVGHPESAWYASEEDAQRVIDDYMMDQPKRTIDDKFIDVWLHKQVLYEGETYIVEHIYNDKIFRIGNSETFIDMVHVDDLVLKE